MSPRPGVSAEVARLGQERPAERLDEEPVDTLRRRRPGSQAQPDAVAKDVGDDRFAAVGLADDEHEALDVGVLVVAPSGHQQTEAIGPAPPDALREDHRRQVLLVELVHPDDRAHVADHEAVLGDIEEEDARPVGLGPMRPVFIRSTTPVSCSRNSSKVGKVD